MNKQTEQEQLAREIADLKHQLAELEASLPKHSVKASQMLRIEDLEDQIVAKQRALDRLQGEA